jgi:steroid delta-isomerase-like uncharacterized protein
LEQGTIFNGKMLSHSKTTEEISSGTQRMLQILKNSRHLKSNSFIFLIRTVKLRLTLSGSHMSSTENKQIAHEFINEIFNKGNLENVDRFVTPDFIYHSAAEDLNGMEKFKEWVSSDRSIFPDIRFTILDSIAEYGKVATAWIVKATHQREFRGIPATHRKFETVGVHIFHFEGNKIKEAWIVVDGLSAALQLGVVKTETSQT